MRLVPCCGMPELTPFVNVGEFSAGDQAFPSSLRMSFCGWFPRAGRHSSVDHNTDLRNRDGPVRIRAVKIQIPLPVCAHLGKSPISTFTASRLFLGCSCSRVCYHGTSGAGVRCLQLRVLTRTDR